MSLLFESIACRNGVLENLRYHEERMNSSRGELLGSTTLLSLKEVEIPGFVDNELWKCRVSFAENIEEVVFKRYEPSIASNFRIIYAEMDYPHKFEDRDEINTLFARRGDADDIIIVVNDYITDSSIANLIFYNGDDWLTPANPLLPGTMRAQLIERGIIIEKEIKKSELGDFEKFMTINALNPFDIKRSLPISQILL